MRRPFAMSIGQGIFSQTDKALAASGLMASADQGRSGRGWDQLVDPELQATIYQRGLHRQGSFMRVYVPDAAAQVDHPLQVMLYLHGFALGLPSFYEAHLRELTRQGWIVIFPDYQPSAYLEEPLQAGLVPAPAARRPFGWGATTWRLLRRDGRSSLQAEDLPDALHGLEGLSTPQGGSGLPELRVKDLRRVLLPWLLIQLVLMVIGWFRRTYARNLGQLIGTVLLSLAYSPKHWLANAMAQAEQALSDLSQEPRYAHWAHAPMESCCFGHSLGGLLGLSLPSLAPTQAGPRLQPKVIVAADPATNTEMGIPGFAIWLLKCFQAPFTADPISIRDTGSQLLCPVAILHGLADTMVPPQQWAVAGGGGDFSTIASEQKALYFASSNSQKQADLIAFHNQAVTSTQYYDDALFANFGGVKDGPNAYNTAWIWPALRVLCRERVDPRDLLAHLPDDRPFAVSSDPPARKG